MPGHGRVFLFLVAAIVLAGCSGGDAKTAPSTSASVAPPPTVTAETGSIEGTVVDEEQQPVPGVSVALIEPSLKQTTDVQGKFVFNNLTEGKFKLIGEKLGYDSVARVVEVKVGEVTPVSITIKELQLEPENLVEMTPYKGLIQCSVNPYYVVNPCGGVTGEDKDTFLFNVDGNRSLKEAVFELVWKQASAATSETLEIDVCDDVTNRDAICVGADYWEWADGSSPVTLRLSDLPVKNQQTFLMGVGTPLAGQPVVQQTFDIYLSLCYYKVCDEDYSAIPPS